MPGLGGMFSPKETSDLHHCCTGEIGEYIHHASLPGEGENTASMSGKIASYDVKKLFLEPFPCGPQYLL